MDEARKRERGRRRSRAEAAELVAQFESSGLTRQRFCSEHGFALATLDRYRQWQVAAKPVGKDQWLAVELSEPASSRNSNLTVALARGRRIEVSCDFDARTLEQLVQILERG